MKNHFGLSSWRIAVAATLAAGSTTVFGAPAFPGAQGFGANVTGGRSGSVYHVTTLADSGAGSFRDAVSTGNRIVVFDVGGYITLSSEVAIKSDITIAGQTAPGGGIGVKGAEVSFGSQDNVIIRHMRFRPGSGASSSDNGLNFYQAHDVILDHVSVEFASWNNIDATTGDWTTHPIEGITVQNSIVANPIGQQFGAHTEAPNGEWSWFNNIFANSHNRNPLAKVNTVFINNVLYNCDAGYTTHTSTTFSHDIKNNYFVAGPASGGNFPWYQIDNNQSIYFTGNVKDSNLDGVLNGGSTSPLPGYQGGGTILTSPWSSITTSYPAVSAASAFRRTLSQSGALPRDQVDALVTGQMQTIGSGSVGTGSGTAGPDGGLYTSESQTGLGNGGFGTISGGTKPLDTDNDGVPDYFERGMGWNTNSADSMTIQSSGYARLETYINWLADPHVTGTNGFNIDLNLSQFGSGFTVSPTYSVSSAVNGTVSIVSGSTARFVPTAGFSGMGSYSFTVTDSAGSTMTLTVGVLVQPGSLPIPPTPTGLAAKSGNSVASLTWNASSGAASYSIKRSTTSGGPYTVIAVDSATTSYLDTGLANGTTYYYVVSAANVSGSSANSGQVSVAPTATGSLTIQAESGIYSGGTATSTNTPGYRGTGYANFPTTAGFAEYDNVPGGSSGTAQLVIRFGLIGTDTRTGTLTVNGVSQNITFPPTTDWTNWSTMALNITLNSGAANTLIFGSTGEDLASIDELTVFPTGGISAPPAAPTGLSATGGNGQISLSWTASSGATSYNVKRATTSGGPYTTIASPVGTSYVNTGLANGTTYYYVVTAVNGSGESANSSQVSATPQPPAPAAPTGLSATAGDTQVSLSWTASSGATSYNVKRATTSGGSYTTVASPSGTSYVNTGLANGTTYYYVVSAANGGGESGNSSEVSATPATASGLLVYEGFNYAGGTSITNQDGGFGWGANWSATGNPQDVSVAQASSLSYSTLLTSGGSVTFGPSSAGGSSSSGVYMRQFTNTVGNMAAANGGKLWLSMLYLNTTNSRDGSGFFGEARIGLYAGVTQVGGVTQTAGATQTLDTGTPGTSASIADQISLYNGSTIVSSSVATPRSPTTTQPALLVMKLVADNTSAADTVYLWVNPNLSLGEPNIATANASWTTTDISGVNGLRFQQTGANGGVMDMIDEIRLGKAFGDVAPSTVVPSPWQNADIGSVSAVGSASYNSGVFTVSGSGSGIGAAGSGDEFHYVYQSASGDCSIVARVTSVQNTGANAKAGVMIRETTNDNSIQAMCSLANGYVSFVQRSTTGGSSSTTVTNGFSPAYWVKMQRVGNVFTASRSSDGNTWVTVGSVTATMSASVNVGLAVTSQADGTLTTATFDNVTATP